MTVPESPQVLVKRADCFSFRGLYRLGRPALHKRLTGFAFLA